MGISTDLNLEQLCTKSIIRKTKLLFMGRKVTKEGFDNHWGTDDLHENCLMELDEMNTDAKLQFLIGRGAIKELDVYCLRELNKMHIDDKFRFLIERGVIAIRDELKKPS